MDNIICEHCSSALEKTQDDCGFTCLKCDKCGATIFLCSECGERLYPKTENASCGLFCSRCNEWKIVTSIHSSNSDNKTIYKVLIERGELEDKKKLYLISKISGISYMRLKQNNKHDIEVVNGRIIEIQAILDVLMEHNIHYIIQPRIEE